MVSCSLCHLALNPVKKKVVSVNNHMLIHKVQLACFSEALITISTLIHIHLRTIKCDNEIHVVVATPKCSGIKHAEISVSHGETSD